VPSYEMDTKVIPASHSVVEVLSKDQVGAAKNDIRFHGEVAKEPLLIAKYLPSVPEQLLHRSSPQITKVMRR
jgi:hypothetical protein